MPLKEHPFSNIQESMFCAGHDQGSATCQGDSGGSLTLQV